jgi:hypothetical protein
MVGRVLRFGTRPARTLAGLLVTALALTVILAGCGGSSAPANPQIAKVKTTVIRAFRALADGDGETVCALSTAAGRKTLAASLPHTSCAKVVTLASKRLTASQRAALASIVVRHVAIQSGRAAVTDSDLGSRHGSLKGFIDPGSEPTRLGQQADGSWKLSG